MNKRKKILLTLVALVLVCVVSVMGTLAYLTAQTTAVTNTFVAANLNATLTLDESKANPVDATNKPGEYTLDTEERVTSNSYSLVPGVDVPKDPQVTVDTLSVEAYLFIEVDNRIWDYSGLSFGIDETNWEPLTTKNVSAYLSGDTYSWSNQIYVLKRTVTPSDVTNETNVFNIIANQKMVVGSDYTDSIITPPSAAPHIPEAAADGTLTFTAYLCQAGGFDDALEAWSTCFGSGS